MARVAERRGEKGGQQLLGIQPSRKIFESGAFSRDDGQLVFCILVKRINKHVGECFPRFANAFDITSDFRRTYLIISRTLNYGDSVDL